MCKYITHLRICYICLHEDTVLISERLCRYAKRSHAFGSCNSGISSDCNRTQYQCWQCKENVHKISRAQMLQRVRFH
jgi:hypothetical protein